jgi:3-keto-disaccharide hydrolase
MHQSHSLRRTLLIPLSILIVAVASVSVRAADEKGEGESVFNGKDFSGWKMRNEKRADLWSVVSSVKLNPSNHAQLQAEGKGGGPDGIMFRSGEGDSGGQAGTDILTEKAFGDCDVHVEFMIPEKSNSGVYLMGEYEVQIWSDIGWKKELGTHNTGAVYSTKPPPKIALKPYGQWNTFEISFQAPRFDATGKKTHNARFLRVVLNGEEIQHDVDTPKPTGGQMNAVEKPTGPLMLQGDHGPVAFRNIRVKPTHAAQ